MNVAAGPHNKNTMAIPSLKTQAFYLFVSRVTAFLVLSLSPIILVRLLSEHQFGTYRQILFVAILTMDLVTLRIGTGVYYFYPRKKSDLRALLSQTVTLMGLASMIGAAGFLILGWRFHFLPSGITTDHVLPIALYLLMEAVAQLIDHIFVLEKKPKLVLATDVANSVARLGLVVGAAFLFQNVMAILYALILLSAARLTVVLAYLARKYRIRPGFLNRALLSEQLRFTAPLAASAVVSVLGSQIDKGVISGYMSPQDFAVYSLAGWGIINAIRVVYNSIAQVCVPRFGELAVEKDLAGVRQVWHKMILMNTCVTVPLICFSFVFAVEITGILYTDKYLAAANVWRINMLILVVQMLGFGTIPTALGKTRAILAGNLTRFLLAVPCSVLLILNFGLMGGAVAFVLGFWADALVQLLAGKKALRATFAEFLPWGEMGRISVISLLPALFLPYLNGLGLHYLPTVLLGTLVYFPLVGVGLILTGTVQTKDFRALLRLA
jgi:O-antigen/teichoic acid export membrane protein